MNDTTTTTKIVWNGCDGYVELSEAAARGYDVAGDTLFHAAHAYTAFSVTEIDPSTIPVDEDGDMILDGVFVTETGRFYR